MSTPSRRPIPVPAPVFALLVAVALGCGPIGPLPGGALRGDEAPTSPESWSFVGDVETIQVETNPADPYSVNTWCAEHEGALYVPTSLILGAEDPNERQWVQNVIADSRVRLRIDDVVYPLTAVRVDDAAEREAARETLMRKYEVESDDHSQGAWIFRMEPR